MNFGRTKIPVPEEFPSVYLSWRRFEITQSEAADMLGVSQQTFSSWKTEYESQHEMSDRGSRPLPDGFFSVYTAYKKGEFNSRQAGAALGISHTAFLKHVRKVDEMMPCRPVSLSEKVNQLAGAADQTQTHSYPHNLAQKLER